MEIIVLFGGKSAEHDISILTATAIMQNIQYNRHSVTPVYIDRQGHWFKGANMTEKPDAQANFQLDQVGQAIVPTDVLLEGTDQIVFPALHGPNGEDGTIQGLFESLNVAYVGAGVLASAAGMDKIVSKHLLNQAGLPQVPFVALTSYEWEKDQEVAIEKVTNELAYPVFVKPANMGSSVGVSEAIDDASLLAALTLAFRYDRRVLVETSVQNPREVELAVLGNDEVFVSVPGELAKGQGFYNYEEKYLNNTTEMVIPAAIDEPTVAKLQDYARKAFLALDGSGLSRADFFLTETGEIYINEVNTLPGFTQFSMYPSLWEASGKSYADLLEELIQLGLSRYNKKQSIQQSL